MGRQRILFLQQPSRQSLGGRSSSDLVFAEWRGLPEKCQLMRRAMTQEICQTHLSGASCFQLDNGSGLDAQRVGRKGAVAYWNFWSRAIPLLRWQNWKTHISKTSQRGNSSNPISRLMTILVRVAYWGMTGARHRTSRWPRSVRRFNCGSVVRGRGEKRLLHVSVLECRRVTKSCAWHRCQLRFVRLMRYECLLGPFLYCAFKTETRSTWNRALHLVLRERVRENCRKPGVGPSSRSASSVWAVNSARGQDSSIGGGAGNVCLSVVHMEKE